MFNNTTIILIVILLLIIYLFDNIKDLEEKILSNKSVKNIFITDYYEPRRRYFKDLYYKQPKKPKPKPPIPSKGKKILPIYRYRYNIMPEIKSNIPGEDKFISGAKSTTIVMENNNNDEQPQKINNVDEPYYN